jgi:hypothetical protein
VLPGAHRVGCVHMHSTTTTTAWGPCGPACRRPASPCQQAESRAGAPAGSPSAPPCPSARCSPPARQTRWTSSAPCAAGTQTSGPQRHSACSTPSSRYAAGGCCALPLLHSIALVPCSGTMLCHSACSTPSSRYAAGGCSRCTCLEAPAALYGSGTMLCHISTSSATAQHRPVTACRHCPSSHTFTCVTRRLG